jgi:hypothetical protein
VLMAPKAKAQMYLVPSTTNAAEPLTRIRMRALWATSQENLRRPFWVNSIDPERRPFWVNSIDPERHSWATQLRISLARFGKHSMLLYIHGMRACMHVARML